jgi:predicted MFS family arabinose efflux permease
LGLDNSAFGLLGSMVFLGHALGSIFASLLLQRTDSKLLLVFCLIFNILSLIIFTQTDNLGALALSRTMTGFF